MSSDGDLRARLEALNRAPLPPAALPNRSAAHTRVTIEDRSNVPAPVVPAPPPAAVPAGRPNSPPNSCPIPGLLRRGAVVETPVGPHLQVDLPLDQLWNNGTQCIRSRQDFLREQLQAAADAVEPRLVMHPEFAAFVAALPDRALALDLETCGLAGSALFLVGMLRQIEGVPTVQLCLARNYAEEAAVLDSLWRIVARHDVLLTFNGKSFDWPMVVERSIRHRLTTEHPAGWAPATNSRTAGRAIAGAPHPANQKVHIDILHHARRRWRRRLPNCRLQTLEQHVCRRTRGADIPGHLIPGVYSQYVRTGFEREMDIVLYHNALDLVTLFDLAHRLAG